MRERGIEENHAEFGWLEGVIDKLVADESDDGERIKQEWEEAMRTIDLPVLETTEQLGTISMISGVARPAPTSASTSIRPTASIPARKRSEPPTRATLHSRGAKRSG